VLGRPEIVMEGIDLDIHDSAQAYRAAVAQIKYDELSLGALVTTHKIDLFEAARDLLILPTPMLRSAARFRAYPSETAGWKGMPKTQLLLA